MDKLYISLFPAFHANFDGRYRFTAYNIAMVGYSTET